MWRLAAAAEREEILEEEEEAERNTGGRIGTMMVGRLPEPFKDSLNFRTVYEY